MKTVAGPNKILVEFGLRRAQGPDGAMMASEYSYIGGFHGSSNMWAGKAFDVMTYGTMAHSYICSFSKFEDCKKRILDGKDLFELAVKARKELKFEDTNDGEFTAFCAYARDHPENFVALVDTYNTLESGVKNFIAVSKALSDIGY
eukprot:CAMPEP_0114594260 /NCGR_PEP_ID=MMETSP0125-20121206/15884_1 /TAXON_ID=485358 ORGANISM="Aristerostoma sp., Strain ATCC 50986" /NCGR_SAMPLE_ID=MMETSP0125 /ASSEMBLY_ACC=CAM_ASM_000245 /LENGTH=145 /DNA_ID=CAMNT_0001794321 /DNA_START=262 /DNA_END=699 /DNA_ORIENTATION=+